MKTSSNEFIVVWIDNINKSIKAKKLNLQGTVISPEIEFSGNNLYPLSKKIYPPQNLKKKSYLSRCIEYFFSHCI